jgi:hypothetical protein
VSFAISPSDYLTLLKEELADFQREPLSIKRAITVSLFANHIIEHIFAAYWPSDPAKLDGCQSVDLYRAQLTKAHPSLGLIRDLCDYSKHGPRLHRATVQVKKTQVKETMVPDFMWLAMGAINHHAEDKIVISLVDGREIFFDGLIDDVVQFWSALFSSKGL